MPGWLISALFAIAGLVIAAIIRVFFAPAVETLSATVLGRLFKGDAVNVRGLWQSDYEYPSRGELKTASQLMNFAQIGINVYAKNVGGSSPHKHALKLKVKGHYLTGTWSNGADSANHHGAVQMRLAADGVEMTGRWVGFDSGGVVQGGSWTMKRM